MSAIAVIICFYPLWVPPVLAVLVAHCIPNTYPDILHDVIIVFWLMAAVIAAVVQYHHSSADSTGCGYSTLRFSRGVLLAPIASILTACLGAERRESIKE
jgi:hypothetical protein